MVTEPVREAGSGDEICPRRHSCCNMDPAALEPSSHCQGSHHLGQRWRTPLAKYYDGTYPSTKEQKNFEKNIFSKTHKNDSEIAFLEGLTVIYKNCVDLYFYIVGSPHENELMLMSVLNCLFESVSQMLRKNVEKKSLMDNMDGLLLITDEIVDGGVILESDPHQVIQKVNFRVDDTPLTEQSMAQVLQSAKEQIKWSLLK
ncbi:coatomer subunit zeta-2 [Amblyraja radiata]|uniref:coatomer subunit zeta-2 n=1 Tax=Amblyraja radiata TaxID=386614 RepID=UPI0014025623|nr:coatomer subunit zeta-2 [Amblyraja radiata]